MDREQGWARVTAAAARPTAIGDRDAVLRVAVQLGMAVAPGMVGCSVTQGTADGYRTPLSSTPVALVMDLAQYDSGDGPCVAAATSGRTVRLDAAEQESRFPEFAAAAAGNGVRSSLSLPLAGGPEPAALNLYAGVPMAFGPPRPRSLADLLARCMAALLHPGPGESTGAAGPPEAVASPEAVAAAMARRRLIQAAEAALMVGDRLSRTAAFARLTALSKAEKRSIFDVAQDVLDRVNPEALR